MQVLIASWSTKLWDSRPGFSGTRRRGKCLSHSPLTKNTDFPLAIPSFCLRCPAGPVRLGPEWLPGLAAPGCFVSLCSQCWEWLSQWQAPTSWMILNWKLLEQNSETSFSFSFLYQPSLHFINHSLFCDQTEDGSLLLTALAGGGLSLSKVSPDRPVLS